MSTTVYNCGNDHAQLRAYASFYTSGPLACGEKMPNSWGLFDMHGNVWEWCWDENPDVESMLVLRRGPRVLRGGSFCVGPKELRSAHRGGVAHSDRWYDFGFRVARSP